MKPNTDTTIRREGNLGQGRRTMTINQEDLGLFMEHLTDLYTDQAGACIREYPSNADDSHKEAGTTRPIEVTLPTMEEPTFVVQDFGVGLSVNQIHDEFSEYGYSSKRETDEQVGMMGLGCKAALAYTSQFTVIAVKDGVEATVHIDRAEDGTNGVEVVDTVGTDACNGVTIRIPVHDVRTFRDKANEAFRYWRDGILVDGEPPQQLEGDWIDPDVLITYYDDFTRHGTGTQDIIVMGNIPYPVPSEVSLSEGIMRGRATVFVPIGSVDPVTSREGLRLGTKRTKQTLDMAREFISESIIRRAQDEIEAASSPREAIRLAHKWNSTLNGSNYHHVSYGAKRTTFHYRGRSIPHELTMPPGWTYYPDEDTASVSKKPYKARAEYMLGMNLIVGHPTKTVTRKQRELIRGMVKDDRPYVRFYLVADLDWADGWLDNDERVWSWEQVEAATPLPVDGKVRAAKVKPNPEKLQMFDKECSHRPRRIDADDAPNTARTIYASPADIRYDQRGRNMPNRRETVLFFARTLGYSVVLMHPRSFGKFHREHPRTLSMPEAIIKETKALVRRQTDIEQAAMALGNKATHSAIAALKADELLDPELGELCEALHRAPKMRGHFERLNTAAVRYGVNVKDLPQIKRDEMNAIEAILERYPLLTLVNERYTRELTNYVNGQFLLRTKEEEGTS